MTEKKMTIFEKMMTISNEVSRIAKDMDVGTGKNKYKAVSEEKVLSAVKPLEFLYGVYSYPYSRKVIDSGEITSRSFFDGKEVEKRQLFLRIETVYRFVNVENPEEYIDVTTYGDGVDSQDKATGKAMTYADKYALMKAYKLITGDDPDKDFSDPLEKVEHGKVGKKKEEPAESKPIGEKEKNILRGMCEKRGLDPAKVFSDIDSLTVDQYLIAVKKLSGEDK